MVAQISPMKRTLVILGGSAAVMVSTPAYADSNAASTDIIAPIRDAQQAEAIAVSPLGKGDAQFRQIFDSWQSLDDGAMGTISSSPIAVPSRSPLNDARLTSSYGMRTHPVLGKRRKHSGIDLAASTGTPIYATADGYVSRSSRWGSYGLFVSLEHGAGVQTRYAHMSRLAVGEGERVKKGRLIGYVGSTGRSTGPHLHYEVRVNGQAVNPIPYMAETQSQKKFALALSEGGQGGL